MNLPHFHRVAQNTKPFQMWDKVGQRIKLRKKKQNCCKKRENYCGVETAAAGAVWILKRSREAIKREKDEG